MSDPTTAERELLPCPFCGSAAEMQQVAAIEDNGENAGGYYIECVNRGCSATTALRFSCGDDCRPALLETWNRRAGWQARAGYGEQSADDTFVARPVALPVAWLYEWLIGTEPNDLDVLEREVRFERDLDEEDGARVTPLYAAPVDREGRLDTGDAK